MAEVETHIGIIQRVRPRRRDGLPVIGVGRAETGIRHAPAKAGRQEPRKSALREERASR